MLWKFMGPPSAVHFDCIQYTAGNRICSMKTAEKQGRRTSLSFCCRSDGYHRWKARSMPQIWQISSARYILRRANQRTMALSLPISFTAPMISLLRFFFIWMTFFLYTGGTLYLSSMGSIEFSGHNIQLLIYVIITSIPCFSVFKRPWRLRV